MHIRKPPYDPPKTTRILTFTLCLTLLFGVTLVPNPAYADSYSYLSSYQACIYGLSASQVIQWDSMMFN